MPSTSTVSPGQAGILKSAAGSGTSDRRAAATWWGPMGQYGTLFGLSGTPLLGPPPVDPPAAGWPRGPATLPRRRLGDRVRSAPHPLRSSAHLPLTHQQPTHPADLRPS